MEYHFKGVEGAALSSLLQDASESYIYMYYDMTLKQLCFCRGMTHDSKYHHFGLHFLCLDRCLFRLAFFFNFMA